MTAAKKKTQTETKSVAQEAECTTELKAIAAKIKDLSLPTGSPISVQTRLEKLSELVSKRADSIQKAIANSSGSIERKAKRIKKLADKIKKDQAALAELQS